MDPDENCTSLFPQRGGAYDVAAALSEAYCLARGRLLWVLPMVCVLNVRLLGSHCSEHEYCHVGWLVDAVGSVRRRLHRSAQAAARRAIALGAPVPLAALAEFVSGADGVSPQMTNCETLVKELARLQESGAACAPVYRWVLICTAALGEAADSIQSVMADLRPLADQVTSASLVRWPQLPPGFAAPSAVLPKIIAAEKVVDAASGRPGSGPAMAEVGVCLADTSEAMLRHFPSLSMLLVDPFDLNEDRGSPELTTDTVRETALARTAPYRDRARHVLEPSAKAALSVADAALDIVFIDADHRYENCLEDILAWWPKLRAGGLFAGHDYHIAFPGVVQAVNELALATGLHLQLGSGLWWFVKPPE